MKMEVRYEDIKENQARASSNFVSISPKQAFNVCSMISGINVLKAEAMLEEVISKRRVVPFKRYISQVAHHRGIAAGRYPVNCCKMIKEVVRTARLNAKNKGLTGELVIVRATSNMSLSEIKRKRYERGRLTNIQIVVEEVKKEVKEKKKINKIKTVKVKATVK